MAVQSIQTAFHPKPLFGVLPLALGSGAGAAGRIAIGTAVLGGTIISTLLGLLFVPLFFVWVRSRVARRKAV